MERIPNVRYTQEFREEAVKMVTDGGLSVMETSKRLSLPKTTLENWIRVSKTGQPVPFEGHNRQATGSRSDSSLGSGQPILRTGIYPVA